jgi:hypothetical protein
MLTNEYFVGHVVQPFQLTSIDISHADSTMLQTRTSNVSDGG